MPIRTIIVDDEKLARDGIKLRLKENKDFMIIDECSGGGAAVSSILKNKPDLVFLDIQMPEINGFGVIEQLLPHNPPIIVFVTAYDKYAINAFKVNALDYILKPIDDERFVETLERVKTRYHQKETCEFTQKIKKLLSDYSSNIGTTLESFDHDKNEYSGAQKILVKSGGKISFVETTDIIWVEAADDYLFLHTSNKKHLLRKRMKEFLNELPPNMFLQVHRSAIVNTKYICEIIRTGINEEYLLLTSNTKLKISRTYKKQLLCALKQI